MGFKVICIHGANAGFQGVTGSPVQNGEEVYEGETYTVINEMNDGYGDWYFLSERHGFICYNQKRFVRISEIDETEYSTIKEKEIV